MMNRFQIRPVLVAASALLLAPLAPGEVDLAAQAVGARTWTHSDGRKVKAGIETASETKVLLRLSNGQTAAVELTKLSDEDRQHVASWLKNNAAPAGFGNPDQTVEITALKGNLKYNKASITVYPGKKIKLILRNADDMHHNLVICKRSKDKGMSVAEEAWKLGADGFAKHWIPKHDSLLFASKMAEPHSTATLYFTAPKKTGKYPFVCTLPGHAQIMNGTMMVSTKVNPLSELTFTVFEGSWKMLPDWDKLKPTGTDHVQSGKFDLAVTKKTDNFGIVYNGKLAAPADGDYSFTIGSDDGSRLLINRKVVIDHDGIHGMQSKSGKIKLSKGSHDIEVQYFEAAGGEELYVGWKPPGAKKESALSVGGNRSGGGGATGHLLVADNEARIYRNFVKGAGPRAIAVGYAEGVNLAYDANNLRLAMIWRGDFIDAARHWNGRGQGFQPPAGEELVNGPPGVPLGVLASPNEQWPTEFQRADNTQQPPTEGGYVFKGYELIGDARIPSFHYSFGELTIQDSPTPSGSQDSENAGFVRTLKITGPAVANLYFRAAVAPSIEPGADGSYRIGEELIMHIKSGAKPIVREAGGQKELLIPVKFGGKTATIEQTITWQ